MIDLNASTDRRVGATVVSGQRDTVPSYNDSHCDARLSEVEVGHGIGTRSRLRERFLKGPIMMRDIATAARLSGQSLAVYLAIRHRRDLTGKLEVTLPKALMEELGVSRDAKARALLSLERAGLVRVTRQAGQSARVSLADQSGKVPS